MFSLPKLENNSLALSYVTIYSVWVEVHPQPSHKGLPMDDCALLHFCPILTDIWPGPGHWERGMSLQHLVSYPFWFCLLLLLLLFCFFFNIKISSFFYYFFSIYYIVVVWLVGFHFFTCFLVKLLSFFLCLLIFAY